MRRLAGAFAALALSGSAAAGAWQQERGHGLVITQAGVSFPEAGDMRLLNEGYTEWGLGSALTAVLTYDSTAEPALSQSVWHGTLGLRYSHRFEFLPDMVFGLEPRFGYQTHESVVFDPVFGGDGWSYGLRFDAGLSFEVWDRHGFANLGLSASTRSEADGEFKLELVAGLDLAEDWQITLGYFATEAPGDFSDQGAYGKHDVGLTLVWHIDATQSLAASVTQTIAADRTSPETALRLALWTTFAPEPEE